MGHLQIWFILLQFHLTFPSISFSCLILSRKRTIFQIWVRFVLHILIAALYHNHFLINFTFYVCFLGNEIKIAGASRGFEKGRKNLVMESDDSSCSIGIGKNIQSFSPSTPPLTASSHCRIAKRRKGIPHRSPMG